MALAQMYDTNFKNPHDSSSAKASVNGGFGTTAG